MEKYDKYLALILCCIAWLLTILLPKTILVHNKMIFVIMGLGFCLYFYLSFRKEGYSVNKIYDFIFIGSFLVRLFYIWSTPYNISPHDLGKIVFGSTITGGHLGYIGYLLYYHHLPSFNPLDVGGFYNPPLYHIISALWLKFNLLLKADWQLAVNNLRILTLFYITLSVTIFGKLLDEFKITGYAKLVIFTLFAFFPSLIWLSGTLSSDSLVFLIMLLILFQTIKWYNNKTFKNIIILAFIFGFGMLVKLQIAFMILGIVYIILASILHVLRFDNQKAILYVKQGLLFATISFPLECFWGLRNFILYKIPLTYVPALGVNSEQYIGVTSFWNRLGLPALKQLPYAQVKFQPLLDCNIWLTMFRTALFDEGNIIKFTSKTSECLGIILLYITILTVVFMAGCSFFIFYKRCFSVPKQLIYLLIFMGFPLFLSYIRFCFAYPHVCTMNFRYIAFLFCLPCLGAGMYFTQEQNKGYWFKIFAGTVVVESLLGVILYVHYCWLL